MCFAWLFLVFGIKFTVLGGDYYAPPISLEQITEWIFFIRSMDIGYWYFHWLTWFSQLSRFFCGLLTSCAALEMVQFCLTDGVSTWSGTIKGLTTSQLEDIGCQIILGNTYHLALRPTSELLDEVGGLHNFMNWPRALLTDSGGFQMVVYGFMYLYSCLPWLCMHFCDF